MSRERITEDEMLTRLREFKPPGAWARPMDLGGTDGSNHSRVLASLVRKGLVERAQRDTLANDRLNGQRPRFDHRGSNVYRIVQGKDEP